VAAFDNDGTAWFEKPTYPQADFLAMRWVVNMSDDFKVVFGL
jgi:hypothetical protein